MNQGSGVPGKGENETFPSLPRSNWFRKCFIFPISIDWDQFWSRCVLSMIPRTLYTITASTFCSQIKILKVRCWFGIVTSKVNIWLNSLVIKSQVVSLIVLNFIAAIKSIISMFALTSRPPAHPASPAWPSMEGSQWTSLLEVGTFVIFSFLPYRVPKRIWSTYKMLLVKKNRFSWNKIRSICYLAV